MNPLRIGVAAAVLNDQDEILLSRRGDLGVWNLPTGRLDPGEALAAAAQREVQEETGIVCEVARPLGLYYQQGRSRLNVLFLAWVVGGALQSATAESTENRFFSAEMLPKDFFGDFMAKDALAGVSRLHVLVTPPAVLRRVQRQLAWRYVKNLLTGRPEPRWPRFEVHASLAVLDRLTGTVLANDLPDGTRSLPGCRVNGASAPWEQVRAYVRDQYGVYELRTAELRWIGLYQHVERGVIEFIFHTEIAPASRISERGIAWTLPDSERWLVGYRRALRGPVNRVVTLLEPL